MGSMIPNNVKISQDILYRIHMLFPPARLDGELQDAALIRQENSALRRLVDQQRGQLEQAQREVGESHAHLVRLEEVASRLTMRSGQSASNSHSVRICECSSLMSEIYLIWRD